MHISELAAHHVENPREVVSQGDIVKVKIIDIDAERRRLSLSMKRVLERRGRTAADRAGARRGALPDAAQRRRAAAAREPYTGSTELTEDEQAAHEHELGLSADVFSDEPQGDQDVELDLPEPALVASEDDDVLKLATALNNDLEGVETVAIAEAVEVEPEPEARPRSPRTSPRPRSPSRTSPRPRTPSRNRSPRPRSRSRTTPSSSRPRTRRTPKTRPRSKPRPRRTPTTTTPSARRTSRRPLLIGLTGAIGAGKSSALAAFARHGAAVLSSDQVVHDLYRTPRSATQSSRGSGPRCWGRTARSTARRSARGCSATPS